MRYRAIVATLMGLVLAVAFVAPAAAAYSNCNVGYVCGWYDTNGGGTRVELYGNGGTCVSFAGQPWDNQFDSFRNNMTTNGRHVQFYDNSNCTGQLLWRDSVWGDGGPFAVGVQDNFEWSTPRGGAAVHHRNRASSAFFNTGFAGPDDVTAPRLNLMSSALVGYNCANASWVCLFSGQNGTGTRYVLVEPASQPLCQGLPGFFNDKAHSAQNNTSDVVTVFEHGNCTGVGQNIPAHSFGNLNLCAFCVAGKVSALKWQ